LSRFLARSMVDRLGDRSTPGGSPALPLAHNSNARGYHPVHVNAILQACPLKQFRDLRWPEAPPDGTAPVFADERSWTHERAKQAYHAECQAAPHHVHEDEPPQGHRHCIPQQTLDLSIIEMVEEVIAHDVVDLAQ